MPDWTRFETVPIAVRARRLFVDEYVAGRMVPKGCWIVEPVHGTGQTWIVPDDVFREGYSPVDSASEAAWNEKTDTVYPTLIGKGNDLAPVDLNRKRVNERPRPYKRNRILKAN